MDEHGIADWLEPTEGQAVNINYSDDAPIDDDDARRICNRSGCVDHSSSDEGSGTNTCPVPDTWGELRDHVDSGGTELHIPSDRRDLEASDSVYEEPTAIEHTENLQKQKTPEDSMCPYCGGDPTGESEVKHRLSAMGYKHDDVELKCSDCGETWPCGVPIGSYDGKRAAELFCDSCQDRYMLTHRVEPNWKKADEQGSDGWEVLVHLKCPNCYYFKRIRRSCGNRGVALMGYPQITGEIDEEASPDGYKSHDDVL